MLSEVFKLCGQFSIGPKGVVDQSRDRILFVISPEPGKKSIEVCNSAGLACPARGERTFMVAALFPARCLDAVPFFFINGCSGP